MRISVVIATYNRASLLAGCLAQLGRQAYEPGDEIVVVDNGSRDDTRRVIERAAALSPVPLRYLHEAAPGKPPAMNAGVGAATGDVLALTDDDVLVADDWIATLRAIFSDPGIALAGGRVDPRWERPAPGWLPVDPHRPYGRMTSPLALLHYGERQVLGQRTAVGANMAVRREVLAAVGGFALSLGRLRGSLLGGEDHDLCHRVAVAGYRCEYRPELRAQHWVPAERLRLRYYARWFYWSGITNALLDTGGAAGGRVTPYWWGRLLAAPANAGASLLRRQPPAAVAALMDGAFALGYISRRLKDQWGRAESPPVTAAGRARE
jgi:GT2 family glycosyltransferase